MKVVNDILRSIDGLQKYSNNIKIFLLIFLVIASLPIHLVTGSNIQSVIGDGFYHYMNYNRLMGTIFHTLITILFVLAYQTKDSMLFCLVLFFIFHDTDRNKDLKDQGHWYV